MKKSPNEFAEFAEFAPLVDIQNALRSWRFAIYDRNVAPAWEKFEHELLIAEKFNAHRETVRKHVYLVSDNTR